MQVRMREDKTGQVARYSECLVVMSSHIEQKHGLAVVTQSPVA